jgi:hypothetical protein
LAKFPSISVSVEALFQNQLGVRNYFPDGQKEHGVGSFDQLQTTLAQGDIQAGSYMMCASGRIPRREREAFVSSAQNASLAQSLEEGSASSKHALTTIVAYVT